MSSAFFSCVISYVTQFLKKKETNQMKKLNGDISKNANENELKDWSKF